MGGKLFDCIRCSHFIPINFPWYHIIACFCRDLFPWIPSACVRNLPPDSKFEATYEYKSLTYKLSLCMYFFFYVLPFFCIFTYLYFPYKETQHHTYSSCSPVYMIHGTYCTMNSFLYELVHIIKLHILGDRKR